MPIYFDSEDGTVDARAALLAAVPDAEKRFNRYCRGLEKLLKDVNEHFPDAEYFVVNDKLSLIMGYDDSDRMVERDANIALDFRSSMRISGGDI